MLRSSVYAAHERRAERFSAIPAGFFYNQAEYGAPEYTAITAGVRHGALGTFSFGGPTAHQTSSLAVAILVACGLTANAEHPLHAELARRERMAFIRSEVARRNRILGRAARFSRSGDHAAASSEVARAQEITSRIALQHAFLDPNSPKSQERAENNKRLRDKINARRATSASAVIG